MANIKAFSHLITANTSVGIENGLVHESCPTWVLTFVRWEYRDTLRTHVNNPETVRPPLVVENDCVQLTVADSKSNLTPSMQATLVMTDINYETEIAPGDFVFVNILNWEADARRVATNAKQGKPINGVNDGFKGFFKIQGVRKNLSVDANTGIKIFRFKVDGFAFTEFNNSIYFDPNLINAKSLSNQGLYLDDIGHIFSQYATISVRPTLQELIAILIQGFIGSGVGTTVAGQSTSPNNTHFLVPLLVGKLLGVVNNGALTDTDYKNVISAKDLFIYLFGIQNYSAVGQNVSLGTGMNPTNLSTNPYPNFYYTNTPCPGNSILKAEYWNNQKTWDILNQYTNAPLNELYTCFRISKTNNRVMPTVIFRQTPFTTEDFVTQSLGIADNQASTIPITRFLTLPRWHIDASFVLSLDIGREEAARVNFVQFYATAVNDQNGNTAALQCGAGNYMFDQNDITRSGLRPIIINNQFQDLPDQLTNSVPFWARIMGDAYIGSHLKLNGTLNCIGIVEPIAVGDNVQFDNTVYHLESFAHACAIDAATGIKSFRTTLNLSQGISVNSSQTGTEYSEMAYPDAKRKRIIDYKYEQILPGVSESQDVLSRPTNLDAPTATENSFPQPSLVKNKPKTGE